MLGLIPDPSVPTHPPPCNITKGFQVPLIFSGVFQSGSWLLYQFCHLFEPTDHLLLVWCWFGAHDSGMRVIPGRWASNLVASSPAFVIRQQSAISNNDQTDPTFHGKTPRSCTKSQGSEMPAITPFPGQLEQQIPFRSALFAVVLGLP